MNYNDTDTFLKKIRPQTLTDEVLSGPVDFSQTAKIKVDKDLYLEAQKRGLSLSELLELPEYDSSPAGSPLDAFERQLAYHGLRTAGKSPVTVEMFYQTAPALLPEFMMREIRRGQNMRPELKRLIASTSGVNTSRYTPFHIDTSATDSNLSLRPVGEAAEVPAILVTDQANTIVIPDYGLTLKVTYRALRYRTMAQFKVLLWYIGYRLASDKVALAVNTIINGDGNDNAATVFNTDVSGSLDYDDMVQFFNEFFPYRPNVMVCHKDVIHTILNISEFKDPMIGFKFQTSGEITSPLGATLVRCDEVPSDYVVGLDYRFALEEVFSQPLTVEYDKVIEQKLEEAVISESVAYAKIIKDASLVLDITWS
ncbi:MAG: hypothetical protein B6D58_03745 [candidate division Zixibacteria bacterium 4484_95]|nr:MAG: hypothetical protein B6D58_03745 [candidate division Zixibacteria bacterium 4484_95]